MATTIPLWQQRLDRHAADNPSLAKRYSQDYGFDYNGYAESIRKKSKLDSDEFYGYLFEPEEESAADTLASAVGQGLLGAATSMMSGPTQPATAQLGSAEQDRIISVAQSAGPEAAARLRYGLEQQQANQAARESGEDASVGSTLDAVSQRYQSSYYAGRAALLRGVANGDQGAIQQAVLSDPSLLSRSKEELLQEASGEENKARAYAQEAAQAPQARSVGGLLSQITGEVLPSLAVGAVTGGAGSVAGLGARGISMAAGGGASLSSLPNDVATNIQQGMSPEEATRTALRQAAVRGPLDTVAGAFGGSRLAQAATQMGFNITSNEASERVARREADVASRLIAAVSGAALGAAAPNTFATPKVQTGDATVDAGAQAAANAIAHATKETTNAVSSASPSIKEKSATRTQPAPTPVFSRPYLAEYRSSKPASAAEIARRLQAPQGAVETVSNVPSNLVAGAVEKSIVDAPRAPSVDSNNVLSSTDEALLNPRVPRNRNERAVRLAPMFDNGEALLQDAPVSAQNALGVVQRTGIDEAQNVPSSTVQDFVLDARPKRLTDVVNARRPETVDNGVRNVSEEATPLRPEDLSPARNPQLDAVFRNQYLANVGTGSRRGAARTKTPIRATPTVAASDVNELLGASRPERVTVATPAVASGVQFDAQGAPRRARNAYANRDELIADLTSGVGNREAIEARRRQEAGKLRVYSDSEDLRAQNPTEYNKAISDLRKVTGRDDINSLPARAWYDPKSDSVHIIASNVDKGTVKGLLLHEAMSHGVIDVKGRTASFYDAIADLGRGGNKLAQDALKDVVRKYQAVKGTESGNATIRKEVVAKFGEMVYQARQGKGVIGRAANLYNQIVAGVRSWIGKYTGLKLTENDVLQAMRAGRELPSRANTASAEAPMAVRNNSSFDVANEAAANVPIGRSSASRFARAALLPEGNADRGLFDELVKAQRGKSAAAVVNKTVLEDVTKAVEDKGLWTPAVNYMQGASDGSDLPANVRALIEPFRSQRATNSDVEAAMLGKMLEEGKISVNSPEAKRLGAIIANRDSYTRRSYQAEDDKKFLSKLQREEKELGGKSRYTKALDHIKQIWTIRKPVDELSDSAVDNYSELWGIKSSLTQEEKRSKLRAIQGLSPAQLDDSLRAIRDGIVTGANRQDRASRTISNALARNMSALMKKKNVPDWMRELLGEYKDPVVVAAKTLKEQSELIINTRTLMNIRDNPSIVSAQPATGFDKKLEGEKYGPLDGMYVSKDNADLLENFVEGDMFNTVGSGVFGDIVGKGWRRASSFLKTNVVGLNLSTALAQALGNFQALIATGHAFKPSFYADAPRATKIGTQSGFELNAKEALMDMVEGTRYGILQDSSLSSELKRAVKESELRVARSGPGDKVKQFYDRFRDKGAGLFAATDEAPKYLAWLSERRDLKEAFPDMRDAEIKQMAADRVQQTYFTYTEAPRWVKKLSADGIVLPFTTFLFESIRVPIMNLKVGLEDMKAGMRTGNGKLRNMGVRRLLGSLAVLTAPGFLINDEDERDQAVRQAAPAFDVGGPIEAVGEPSSSDRFGGQVQEYRSGGRYLPFPIVQNLLSAVMTGDEELAEHAVSDIVLGRGVGVKELLTLGKALSVQDRTEQDWQDIKTAAAKLVEMASPIGATPTALVKEVASITDPWARTDRQLSGLDIAPEFSADYFMDLAGRMTGFGTKKMVLSKGTRSALASAAYEYKNAHDENRAAFIKGIVGEEDVTQEYVDQLARDLVASEKSATDELNETVDAIAELKGVSRERVLADGKESQLQLGAAKPGAALDANRLKKDLYKAAEKRELGNKVKPTEVERLRAGKYTRKLSTMIDEAFRKATKEERK